MVLTSSPDRFQFRLHLSSCSKEIDLILKCENYFWLQIFTCGDQEMVVPLFDHSAQINVLC